MEFQHLKNAVAKQFQKMQQHSLFKINADRDEIVQAYLGAFRPEDNLLYRKRTEHDCSCCKSFIRTIGDVVAIIDGKVETIWDGVPQVDDEGAKIVLAKMSEYIKGLVTSSEIKDSFLHYELGVGKDKTFEQIMDKVKTWNHFYITLDKKFFEKKDQIPTKLNEVRTAREVFHRSLVEISQESVDTVLELIAQNSLYRGEEHKATLLKFKEFKARFDKLKSAADKSNFSWIESAKAPGPVARIRNTSIGTLLVDLSSGKELEAAVKSFEAIVAPANYKRPSAIITKSMIEKAKATIEELGLTSALKRRYATLQDISINNVLYADRNVKSQISGGDVFDMLSSQAGSAKINPKKLDKVEEITIDKFLADILPSAKSIEVLVENKHAPNLVSLVAPEDPTAKHLFKWNNNFSWSYAGNLADSDIRAAVQARGGRVDGAFRFSHQWNYGKRNASLMDLHVFMPGHNGQHPSRYAKVVEGKEIHDDYGNAQRIGWNCRQHNRSSGVQDVDYTDAAPEGHVPVENITFPSLDKMPDGKYICKIHNWKLRAPTQGGFKAEIEFGGHVYQYEYDKPLQNKEWITVAEVTLNRGKFEIKHFLPETTSSKTMWNVKTQEFVPVSAIMLSPNFWDDQQIGNKHFFFMLENCRNEEVARGFYNEFLSQELNTHRKVLEMVGSKMTTDENPNQLSGIGFSSTQRAELIVKVTGSFQRTLKIIF